nr:hypothetical protein [Tanacetum cinerariifolium]
GGLPDMIHGSVKASKPQSMQEAIKFATEVMDKKMLTHAERQAEHKRKFDDTSRNNQHQQQPFKRNNVARAYTTGPGDKKPYGGTKPLCPKCNYHYDGPCGHYKSDCPKLKNGNQGNQTGNGNVVARAYAVGTAGTNPNSHGCNCTVACQVKFASCTLQGCALTWWNSHMRAVRQDVAYVMPWAALKRMITDKYCPRGEIQKLESEYWNLKVKGLDLY